MQEIHGNLSCFALTMILSASFAACDQAPENVQKPAPARIISAGACGDNGFMAAELYGSIERSLRWSAADMRCESMVRPDGEGMRLRFTGLAADRQLAIILALPGLEPGRTGKELATVATLTVEGSGRFFSTPNLDSCWSDIDRQDAIEDSGQRYEIAGTLYCVAPLGEVNGEAAISVPELQFRGIIEWGDE